MLKGTERRMSSHKISKTSVVMEIFSIERDRDSDHIPQHPQKNKGQEKAGQNFSHFLIKFNCFISLNPKILVGPEVPDPGVSLSIRLKLPLRVLHCLCPLPSSESCFNIIAMVCNSILHLIKDLLCWV